MIIMYRYLVYIMRLELIQILHMQTFHGEGMDEHKGLSKHGPYGDNVEEMDWSVGKVLDALQVRVCARACVCVRVCVRGCVCV